MSKGGFDKDDVGGLVAILLIVIVATVMVLGTVAIVSWSNVEQAKIGVHHGTSMAYPDIR